MYIHNIYSDLMVALTSYIDRQLPIRLKNVIFNIANVSFAFQTDTQYELPSAIVNLDSVLPYIDHPYVFQFNNIWENKHQQLAIYDYDKDFQVLLQEEYQTFNITLTINCESQIQGFENQKSLISKIPIGKFGNFFKFTSFLELDRPLLNKYLIDVQNDHIDNLFLKHNQITNNTEYVFPMEYNPLIKMNSCDLMINDINSSSYQIICNFEILFPSPTYQVYPDISYLIDLNSFDGFVPRKISKKNVQIPIDPPNVIVDITDPTGNDKVVSVKDIVNYRFMIPVKIRVICFSSSQPEEFNFVDNIYVKQDYTFEKQIVIVKNSIIKTIGTVTGRVISRIKTYTGTIITSTKNIYSKIEITESFPNSNLSGYLYSNNEGSLSAIRIENDKIVKAWFESKDNQITHEIYFEIEKQIHIEYRFDSIISQMTDNCTLMNISSIDSNSLYAVVDINKYSSKLDDIIVNDVTAIITVPDKNTNPIVSTDPIIKDIIINPDVKTNIIDLPVKDQSFDKDGNFNIKLDTSGLSNDPPYEIIGTINNNSGDIAITEIRVNPINSLDGIELDRYLINSDGSLSLKICNKFTNSCEWFKLPITTSFGDLIGTNPYPFPDHIYLDSIIFEPDGKTLLKIYDPLTNKYGFAELPINSYYVDPNGDLRLKFKLQYKDTLFDANALITLGDPSLIGRLNNSSIKQVIPIPIIINSDADFSHIEELRSGYIERINIRIQEFDYTVLANFTISDLNILQHANSYKFVITDYGMQIDSITHEYLVEIYILDLYDYWDKNTLQWKFYFYRASTGETIAVGESNKIKLDKTLSTNTMFVFRCSREIFYQHFDFLSKTNIAFLIIKR